MWSRVEHEYLRFLKCDVLNFTAVLFYFVCFGVLFVVVVVVGVLGVFLPKAHKACNILYTRAYAIKYILFGTVWIVQDVGGK